MASYLYTITPCAYVCSARACRYGFCEQYRSGTVPICDDVLVDGMYLFIPHIRGSLQNVVENVQSSLEIFDLISDAEITDTNCFEAGRKMFCYWYFIPCGRGTEIGLPSPLCMDECLTISEDKCVSEWNTAVSLLGTSPGKASSGFGLPRCCNLTEFIGPVHNCCQPLGNFDRERCTAKKKNYMFSIAYLPYAPSSYPCRAVSYSTL